MTSNTPYQVRSVFIACLARNCEATAEESIRNVVELGGLFEKAYINIYTNDNDDRTYEILQENQQGRYELHNLDGADKACTKRLERMAFCRNMYTRDFRRQRRADNAVNLLISIDFDQYRGLAPASDQLLDCIAGAPEDWGGLFPAHDVPYYDLWALRHESWCPGDCWREVDGYIKRFWWMRLLGINVKKRAMRKFIWSRKVAIPRETPPIEVLSAFGGMGLYRAEFLDRAWYRGLDEDGGEVIEHLHFNTQVRDAGGKLYILPNFVTSLSHSHRSEQWDTSNPAPWIKKDG